MDTQLLDLTHGFINYSIVNGKKQLLGPIYNDKQKNWTMHKAKQEIRDGVYGPMRIVKIKPSTIVCIDIDEPVPYERVIELFPILEGHCYVQGNTKGWHFYVDCPTYKRKQDEIKCIKYVEGDIIINQMFELEGKKWHNDIQQLDLCYIEDMMITDSISETTSETTSETSEVEPDIVVRKIKCEIFHTAILDNINPTYYTSYLDWCKFIWAIYFTFDDPLEIADKYSTLTNGYVSKDDVRQHMESATRESIGWGYLMNLSKKSNLTNYKIAIMDKRALPNNEYDLAEVVIDLCDDIIKVDETLYVYDKPYWVLDSSKKQDAVSKKVMAILRPFYKDYLVRTSSILATQDEEVDALTRKCKKLCRIIDDLGSLSMIHNIASMVRIQLPNSAIEFDNKPYLFCFKNCAFDLLAGKKTIIKKEDYITQHTGFDYIPSTDDQRNLIQKLLHQILYEPEIYRCYLSVLFAGMTGIRIEKFFLANGCGRNGKGLVNEQYAKMLGDYGYILPVDILTSKKEITSGANPQVANCHKKRFILAREPEENSKLRTSIIKDMTGGSEINARQLYSGDCKVSMNQVMLLECNEKPQLSGTMNEAILERIVDIPFKARFTNDPSQVNEEEHIYPINPSYKDIAFQNEHRFALFDILLEADKEVYIPKCITSRSNDYVMSSDEVYNWIIENYDVGTMDDIITVKDLYADYTQCDSFRNMSKEEKRIMNKKKFSQMLKASIAFKGKYKDEQKKINGRTYNERLHGFIQKTPDI